MTLSSFSFLVYFALLLVPMAILQVLRKKSVRIGEIQLGLLLLFSLFFILKSDWRFCLCVLAAAGGTYLCAVLLERTRKKIWLVAGICTLLAALVYFKYTGFFVNAFRRIAGMDSVTLHIILPIGISFYVFGAMSYLIDVFRGECKAEKHILKFALYISFFPKLTAGPIVRWKDFFPQMKEYRGVQWDSFKTGIQIFVFGLFKKIVLADHLGVFVDDVFHAPAAYSTATIILAVISYSLQIYFDFSGYTDMAVGISKILGLDFKPNFNLPYCAQNISEFWKRWHISLSSWFQDYLYIPLGGSRKGTARTYFNLLLVMLVSGLWHGAGWTFIIWGALHGIASCVNKALGSKLKQLGDGVNAAITFVFVTLAWVVFRADSLSNAAAVWRGLFTVKSGISHMYTWSFFAFVCLAVSTVIAWRHSRKNGLTDKSGRPIISGFYPVLDLSGFWAQVAFFTFCGLTVILGYFGNTAFIYGAF